MRAPPSSIAPSPRPRAAALAALALALPACFSDPGDQDPASTGAAASDASTAAASTSATDASTSTSSTSGDPTTLETTGGGATTAPAPVCGDGVVDPGEACDDGNLSDLDVCLSTCQLATCDDGLRSQGESDVDCGGPCEPCGLCQGCARKTDCASKECKGGACTLVFSVTVDYVTNCDPSGEFTNAVVIPGLPAGDYEFAAKSGSGNNWNGPPNPPAMGWSYRPSCQGVVLDTMRTPEGVYYATPEEAFANLIAKKETRPVPAGDLRCGTHDGLCTDNQGAITFEGRYLCP